MKKVESYIFGGVNAVGKTHLFAALQSQRPEIQPVHTAGLLMEWLNIMPGDYDTLRSLPPDYKNRETANAVQEYISQAETGSVLLFDYHYLNLIDGKMTPTVEGDWLGGTDGLILVKAAPTTVHQRIQSDRRDRRLFPQHTELTAIDEVTLLAGFIHETHAEFQRQASANALPSLVVSNEATHLDGVVGSILAFQGLASAMTRQTTVI